MLNPQPGGPYQQGGCRSIGIIIDSLYISLWGLNNVKWHAYTLSVAAWKRGLSDEAEMASSETEESSWEVTNRSKSI